MALDRQSIERRDFPIARRGYDPEAVDAHLARIAEEFEALQRAGAAPGPAPSLASIAGAQVASIVEAAESSAAAIERAAQDDAERTRRDAEQAASSARSDALERSRAHVHHVAEAAGGISDRIDAMDTELRSLSEVLRAGAQRLQADLSLLAGNIEDLYGAAPLEAAAVTHALPAPGAGAAAEPEPEPEPDEDDAVEVHGEPVEEAGDVEGARLIALNMALNGTSREETDRYLAENFDLADRAGLLDEVYASVDA